MAKKSRRARKRNARQQALAQRVGRPAVSAIKPAVQAPEPARPDFHEYRYVITDLKRVAILAASMFALLIALSFFIR
jgi:hypothetical protein